MHFGVLGFAFADTTLLNVSYDPTRELYQGRSTRPSPTSGKADDRRDRDHPAVARRLRQAGAHRHRRTRGRRRHAGARKRHHRDRQEFRARSIADWRTKLPNNASPYTSTIVFLVRKGNPKAINDWGDLIKDGVQVITPNPKTCGGARWNFLAAWAWANGQFAGDEAKIKEFVANLYAHVPVLDTGARGSTVTFAEREQGDVLLAWENEAYLAIDEFGADKFDIVFPPQSILAEPPVAVVDANVDAKGTRKVAEAYLNYLYSAEGQTLAAKHHYRPSKPELVPADALQKLPELKLVSIDDPIFGGWAKAQPYHFGDGGIFDQIYQPAQ